MITIRKAGARGHVDHGWLDTYHTFSFAHYYDPAQMGFSALRVINEDRVAPGQGFGTHGHRDMEILTYVLEGALEHRDSTGGGGVLRPGDVQRMSAGTGVTHSEFNHSANELLHFLQIWILPETSNLAPSYEEKHFPAAERQGMLCLLASRDGGGSSLRLNQDAQVFATILNGQKLKHVMGPGRSAWVQVARGTLQLNGNDLAAGDGAAIREESEIEFATGSTCELLLFDLP